ncbi:hypothetical protein DASC09_047990 [Saccharomycopsis crataegensis]|uniref:Uncharacterized protein n=1 Tax=Saccharomycopsis crataegensis TaxID=43959 RepID=A0AAV5QRV3_9ASCO|nr:hypothetical protein DASC09_047990 [Saccharomycopsis crataegensis]
MSASDANTTILLTECGSMILNNDNDNNQTEESSSDMRGEVEVDIAKLDTMLESSIPMATFVKAK